MVDGGRVFWANPAFSASEEYQVTAGGTVDLTALTSQGNQAMDRLAKRFSREVVTSIFEAF
jgi:hypothetical protein